MPLTHLSTVGKTPRISYAEWSPTGHKMVPLNCILFLYTSDTFPDRLML